MTALQFWFVVAVAWVLLIWCVLAAHRSTKVQQFGHALSKSASAAHDAGRALMGFGNSVREAGQQLKAIEGLADFLPNKPMHYVSYDHDGSGVVANIVVPKHQLPVGWFLSGTPGEPVECVEREDNEIPLSIRVIAAELVNDVISQLHWHGNDYDIDWYCAESAYLFWEHSSTYAVLRLSFSAEWFDKELEALKGGAKDRAAENKRGDT